MVNPTNENNVTLDTLTRTLVYTYVKILKNITVNDPHKNNLNGKILLANHQSMYDVPAIAIACEYLESNQPYFIMRDNIMPAPIQYVMSKTRGINLGKDEKGTIKAIKKAKQRLKENNPLVVFPQATRYHGYFGPLSQKVTKIWTRDYEIVPVGIEYEENNIHVNFGESQKLDLKNNPSQFFNLQYNIASLAKLTTPKTEDSTLNSLIISILNQSIRLQTEQEPSNELLEEYDSTIKDFIEYAGKQRIKPLH